jgi:hypothetical protein
MVLTHIPRMTQGFVERCTNSVSLLKTLNAGETPGFLWLSEFLAETGCSRFSVVSFYRFERASNDGSAADTKPSATVKAVISIMGVGLPSATKP